MLPVFIQNAEFKTAVKNDKLISDELAGLVDKLPKGKVIELRGMGMVGEHMSRLGHKVTLCEAERLAFALRRKTIPDTKVDEINFDPSVLKSSKPAYDYCILNNLSDYDLAKKLAKKAIINLVSSEVEELGKIKYEKPAVQEDVPEENPEPDTTDTEPEPEVAADQTDDWEIEEYPEED